MSARIDFSETMVIFAQGDPIVNIVSCCPDMLADYVVRIFGWLAANCTLVVIISVDLIAPAFECDSVLGFI